MQDLCLPLLESACVSAKEFIVENYQEANIFAESNFKLVAVGRARIRTSMGCENSRMGGQIARQSVSNVGWQDFCNSEPVIDISSHFFLLLGMQLLPSKEISVCLEWLQLKGSLFLQQQQQHEANCRRISMKWVPKKKKKTSFIIFSIKWEDCACYS